MEALILKASSGSCVGAGGSSTIAVRIRTQSLSTHTRASQLKALDAVDNVSVCVCVCV